MDEMSLGKRLSKLLFFRSIFRVDRKVERIHNSNTEVRKTLDRRLDRITRATLNGETEWFLTLMEKREPDCILDIIKECKPNDEPAK
jgi:hypothetical protein